MKQAPSLNIKRKRVCGGAEVITSEEVLVKLKASSDNKNIKGNSARAKKEGKKKMEAADSYQL